MLIQRSQNYDSRPVPSPNLVPEYHIVENVVVANNQYQGFAAGDYPAYAGAGSAVLAQKLWPCGAAEHSFMLDPDIEGFSCSVFQQGAAPPAIAISSWMYDPQMTSFVPTNNGVTFLHPSLSSPLGVATAFQPVWGAHRSSPMIIATTAIAGRTISIEFAFWRRRDRFTRTGDVSFSPSPSLGVGTRRMPLIMNANFVTAQGRAVNPGRWH